MDWLDAGLNAPLIVVRAIHFAATAITTGALIFRTGESRVVATATKLWRARIDKVFALAGPFEEKPTPHRFRRDLAAD